MTTRLPAPEQPISEMDRMRQRALADEKAGKCGVMRDPQIERRPPRKPSWSGWG